MTTPNQVEAEYEAKARRTCSTLDSDSVAHYCWGAACSEIADLRNDVERLTALIESALRHPQDEETGEDAETHDLLTTNHNF